jgi:hypothetical protein
MNKYNSTENDSQTDLQENDSQTDLQENDSQTDLQDDDPLTRLRYLISLPYEVKREHMDEIIDLFNIVMPYPPRRRGEQ